MNEKRLISVIIPIHNGEAYIDHCLQSVRSSSYQNLEIILVENGSTDRSLEMCQRMAEQEDRIRCIHTDESGLSLARNIGIRAARGDYIAFVDVDDYVSPHMYESLFACAEKFGADFSLCDYETGRDQSHSFGEQNPAQCRGIEKDEFYFNSFIKMMLEHYCPLLFRMMYQLKCRLRGMAA